MRPRLILLATLLGLGFASPVLAQTPPDPTSLVTASELQAQVADMGRSLKPGQTFLWRPLVRSGAAVAALEYWTAPGRPAVHPNAAEYVMVIAGAGTLVSGGTMIGPHVVNPGQTDGERIEGATTRHLAPGDVFLIPAGTPHYFGIEGRLVLLGSKLPVAPT